MQNEYGRTVLMEAAMNGRTECLRVAFEAGADVNFATEDGNVTAAMFAAMEGHAECLNALRDFGGAGAS